MKQYTITFYYDVGCQTFVYLDLDQLIFDLDHDLFIYFGCSKKVEIFIDVL